MTKAAGVLPNGRRWMNEHGPNCGPPVAQVREIIGRSGCLHRMRSGHRSITESAVAPKCSVVIQMRPPDVKMDWQPTHLSILWEA